MKHSSCIGQGLIHNFSPTVESAIAPGNSVERCSLRQAERFGSRHHRNCDRTLKQKAQALHPTFGYRAHSLLSSYESQAVGKGQ